MTVSLGQEWCRRADGGDCDNAGRADIQRARLGFRSARDRWRVEAIHEPLHFYLAELDDLGKVIIWPAVCVELVEIRDAVDTVVVDCWL